MLFGSDAPDHQSFPSAPRQVNNDENNQNAPNGSALAREAQKVHVSSRDSSGTGKAVVEREIWRGGRRYHVV